MKLFVRNLPYSMTEDELKLIFEKAGTVVKAVVVKDRYTGKPRGFGFVEMSNRAEGEKAIKDLNGHEVEGRTLEVDKARDNTTNRDRDRMRTR